MKNTVLTIAVLIILACAGISFVAFQKVHIWITLQKQVVQNQAVDGCITTARYTAQVGSTGGSNTTAEPIREWYDFCMKEKKLK